MGYQPVAPPSRPPTVAPGRKIFQGYTSSIGVSGVSGYVVTEHMGPGNYVEYTVPYNPQYHKHTVVAKNKVSLLKFLRKLIREKILGIHYAEETKQ